MNMLPGGQEYLDNIDFTTQSVLRTVSTRFVPASCFDALLFLQLDAD